MKSASITYVLRIVNTQFSHEPIILTYNSQESTVNSKLCVFFIIIKLELSTVVPNNVFLYECISYLLI